MDWKRIEQTTKNIWRQVPYFPDYLISDVGEVRSLKWGRDRLMKPITRQGYLRVGLCIDGKVEIKTVHQLVLLAFVGPRSSGMEVRHLNGIRSDNRLENLKYGTKKENNADTLLHGHHHMANRTECHLGHPFNATNTYSYRTTKGGQGRKCKTCGIERDRRYLLKKKNSQKGVQNGV